MTATRGATKNVRDRGPGANREDLPTGRRNPRTRTNLVARNRNAAAAEGTIKNIAFRLC